MSFSHMYAALPPCNINSQPNRESFARCAILACVDGDEEKSFQLFDAYVRGLLLRGGRQPIADGGVACHCIAQLLAASPF
jgi:hypothetical protein